MEGSDQPVLQEFVVNFRWLCYYATFCLGHSVEARYPSLLSDCATLLDVLSLPATTVYSLASLPLGALQVATDGALYLLVAESLLDSCPPTLHAFLDHLETRKRHAQDPSGQRLSLDSDTRRSERSADLVTIGSLTADELSASLPSNRTETSSEAQAMLLLVKWLVAQQVVSAQALAETLQMSETGSADDLSSDASRIHRRRSVRMATTLAQVSPFYLGAHVVLTRSLLVWHCSAVTTGPDVHIHARAVAGDLWHLMRDHAPWHDRASGSSTIEQDIVLWVDCVLKRVEQEEEHHQSEAAQRADTSAGSHTHSRRRAPRSVTTATNAMAAADYLLLRRRRGTRRYPPEVSLASHLRDGMDVCFVLHFYEPELLPLASVQIISADDSAKTGTQETGPHGMTRDSAARAIWNWGCALRVLDILGLMVGLSAEEIVHLGDTVLPLHVLRVVEEMFVFLATRAEEGLRDSVELAREASLFTTGEIPTSLSASTIPIEPYRASSPSGSRVLPGFSRSGVQREPSETGSSASGPRVVTSTSSQPFHPQRRHTASAQSSASSDDGATAASADTGHTRSPPLAAVAPQTLLQSSLSEWDRQDATEHRQPIRPLVSRSRRSSHSSANPHTRHGHGVSEAADRDETRLSWLDMTEPVAVSARDAVRLVTPLMPAGTTGLVQSGNSSISSVYAVSEDMTEDAALATAASSAVARSGFTVTRTFSKPSKEPPAVVVLQSSTDTSQSDAQPLLEAARVPLPDGSAPFGIYSTPKRKARASVTPPSADDDEPTHSSGPSAPTVAVQLTVREEEEEEDERFEVHKPAETASPAQPAPVTLTTVVPPTLHATESVEAEASPLYGYAGSPILVPHSVSSSDFFSSPSPLVPGRAHDSVHASSRGSEGLDLAEFDSISTRRRPDDEVECEEPSVTINVDEPPESEDECSNWRDSTTMRTDSAPAPPQAAHQLSASTPVEDSMGAEAEEVHSDPAPSTVLTASPSIASKTSAAGSHDDRCSRNSSSSSSSSSDFVVRRIGVPGVHATPATPEEHHRSSVHGPQDCATPQGAVLADFASPSPLGRSGRKSTASLHSVDASLVLHEEEEEERMREENVPSPQTPEIASVAGDKTRTDVSVDGATVYGSQAPSALNDSWFSSVSRPGSRRQPPTQRSLEQASLIDTVREQQRVIEELTRMLQQAGLPTSRVASLRHSYVDAVSSVGARTVERVGRASSVGTGFSGQLAASDVSTALQNRFDAETDGEEASRCTSRPPQ